MADAVMEAGGKVIGVIPEKLKNVEIAHQQLSELHVVNTMHERKALMVEYADGFIAFPGGSGTLEEWFEVFTWAQLGYHNKPCALLNINNYYTPILSLFDHMIEQGFIKMALKLSEEVGETSQAVLSYIKASGSEYKQLGIGDVKEECINVILVALAMFYKLSENDKELHQLISKKLDKWESKFS